MLLLEDGRAGRLCGARDLPEAGLPSLLDGWERGDEAPGPARLLRRLEDVAPTVGRR
ncbi:MAG: hypothetical protein OXD30_07845 [Bryobacterales bacterium]|nr:hypothetical protein [Bryobacterales bacterium]